MIQSSCRSHSYISFQTASIAAIRQSPRFCAAGLFRPGLSQPQDLTHVGVGVSQVLPILVMCLLAEPDTTLIFEQPELHLHPKVQTLLGDFFLSMSPLGKQCVLETHSEYLINRLRFRAAASNSYVIANRIKMYFVEKYGDSSSFRPVRSTSSVRLKTGLKASLINHLGSRGDAKGSHNEKAPSSARESVRWAFSPTLLLTRTWCAFPAIVKRSSNWISSLKTYLPGPSCSSVAMSLCFFRDPA